MRQTFLCFEILLHWEMLYLISVLVENSFDSLRQTEKVAREFEKKGDIFHLCSSLPHFSHVQPFAFEIKTPWGICSIVEAGELFKTEWIILFGHAEKMVSDIKTQSVCFLRFNGLHLHSFIHRKCNATETLCYFFRWIHLLHFLVVSMRMSNVLALKFIFIFISGDGWVSKRSTTISSCG